MMKHTFKKGLAVLLAAVSLSGAFSGAFATTARADNILDSQKGEKGDWFKNDQGGWYYVLYNGTTVRNTWLKDSGKWYFFDKNGYMCRGWIQYNGDWYYLDMGGVMWYSTTTPDGYKLDGWGRWIRK